MADVLSALPAEGGLRVGWTPIEGAVTYQVRYSLAGAGSWTTVTGITTNYTTLSGLDYLEEYDVQVSGDGGGSWSSSVQQTPWLDPADEFGTLLRVQDKHAPEDLGDLGATYENDTWFAVLAVERIRLAAFQSLLGINANLGTADGLAGFIVRFSDGDVLQAIVITGASSSVTIGSGANTFGRGKHVVAVEKSGTTVTLYDEDGASIGSGMTTSSTMDWTTSTTQRTTVNAHWATTVSPNLTGRNTGNMLDAVYVPGGVTSDQRDGLLRLFKERYSTALPTARVELLLDSEHIESNTVGSPSAVALARQGEVLQSLASPSHRSGLSYVDVQRLEDGRFRMWVSALKYEMGSITRYGLLRMDSKDGLTWTEPNLGISGSTGLLRDTTALFYPHNTVRTSKSGEQYLYCLEVDIGGSDTGGQVFAASDEDSAPSLIASVDAGTGVYNEGKFLVFRDSDARPLFYYNKGQGSEDRSIGVQAHAAGGQGATELSTFNTFVDLGILSALDAPDAQNQFYTLSICKLDPTLWLLFVTRYNSSTELTHVDLFVSRDEGLTATSVVSSWLPLGGSGQWDDGQVYAGSLVRVGDEWRLYYTGIDDVHGTGAEGSSIGYATVDFGRVMELVA